MLYFCPVYGQDKIEKCLIYPLDVPEISLWYAWDKMTALWPNDSLTFTLHEPFANSMPKWTTFVKEVFLI